MKGRADCLELTDQYLAQQTEFYEIVYASSMVDKLSLDISPTTAKALASICKIYMLECEDLYPKYQAMTTPEGKKIGAWLQLATLWFKVVALWTIWQINQFITTGMMDKSKGIGKVYLEGHLLGEALLDLKKTAKKMSKLNKSYEDFNFKDSAMYIHDFISSTFEEQLKDGMTKYSHVKGTLDHTGIENHDIHSILAEIDVSNNLIEMIIKKQGGF